MVMEEVAQVVMVSQVVMVFQLDMEEGDLQMVLLEAFMASFPLVEVVIPVVILIMVIMVVTLQDFQILVQIFLQVGMVHQLLLQGGPG